MNLDHLPEVTCAQAHEMFAQFAEMYEGELGEVKGTEHHISFLECSGPLQSVPNPAEPRSREDQQKSVDEIIKSDVTVPYQSEWAPFAVLVPKPDGSLSFCVGY